MNLDYYYNIVKLMEMMKNVTAFSCFSWCSNVLHVPEHTRLLLFKNIMCIRKNDLFDDLKLYLRSHATYCGA